MTVNDALPFCACKVMGADWPFNFVDASPLWRVTRSESFDARAFLQSRSSIVIVEVAPTATDLAETYTCELYSLAVPAQFRGGVVTTTGAEVGSGANVGNGVGAGCDGGV